MSLGANAADFEQGGAGALYANPPYMQYAFFQTRIDALKQRFAPSNQKTLIVGSAFGYLVNLAVANGYDAYGIDNAYATGKAKALFPSLSSRFIAADALVASQLDAAAQAAGIKGGNPKKWALLVTEDVLPCMSDAEIQTALTNLRARCSINLVHLVTPNDPTTQNDPRINWKTIDAWRAVLCPPDIVGDVYTGLFWNNVGQV